MISLLVFFFARKTMPPHHGNYTCPVHPVQKRPPFLLCPAGQACNGDMVSILQFQVSIYHRKMKRITCVETSER